MRASHGPEQTRRSRVDAAGGETALRDAARRYVHDGESLATFLDDLAFAHKVLELPPPSEDVVRNASLAWADEVLGLLVGVACADPLTGMSTPAHARMHLRTLYRTVGDRLPAPERLALVSVTVFDADPARPLHHVDAAFDLSLRLATIADALRTAFDDCGLITSPGNGRVLAVVPRDPYLANRVAELGWLLRRRLPVRSAPRVLLESLPLTAPEACALLDQPD